VRCSNSYIVRDAGFVQLLDQDADLASAVPRERRSEARSSVVAPLIELERGAWEPPSTPRGRGRDLGLLVLSGLLSRDMELAGRTFTELRGPEDLLRPWDDSADLSSVRGRITWKALEPTRMAWLDGEFAATAAAWPEVTAALLERAVRRARMLSFRLAILELRHVHLRVLFLLWHLSDRWGRVHRDGVHLELPLTHDLIAHMVGAHRTSVTLAIGKLVADGRLVRTREAGWLLTGGPPREVSDL
jgi:CRP/FNR family cyclic AMP-dependent transcriptional regulator